MRIGRRKGYEPPAVAAPISYHVPTGESGASAPPKAGRSDSIVRVYAFERLHTAFQRIAARRHGERFDVAHQRVKVRTALEPGARPVAAGGEAVTVLRGEGGAKAVLRELAYTSELRRTFLSSASAFFGEGRRVVPQFELLDAYGSRLRVEQGRDEILRARPAGALSAVRLRRDPAAQARLDAGGRLAGSLGSLLERARGLLDRRLYDGARARTEDPLVAAASATGGEVREGRFPLVVEQLAQGIAVRSDPVADASAALGLKGSFTLNGVRIRVEATDSLGDLARRITHGEDVDASGTLDYAEDRNFNGALDPTEDANGNGKLDADEDELGDGDGQLDRGEDLNYNGRLDVSEDRDFDFEIDGGLSSQGIRARIDANRLEILAESAETRLRFEDPDGILRSIRLLRIDEDGALAARKVSREAMEAEGTLDGKDLLAPRNAIPGALPDVELRLRDEGTTSIRVDRTFTPLAERAEAFFQSYNESVALLNSLLVPGGLFREEPSVNRIRADLGRTVEGSGALSAAGIEASRGPGRRGVHELELEEVLRRVRQGLDGVFDSLSSSAAAAASLRTIGITEEGDGLVRLDRSALEGAFRRDRKEAARLLAGEDGQGGLFGGLSSVLETAADERTGRLRFLLGRMRAERQASVEEGEDLARTLDRTRRSSAVGMLADVVG